MNMTDALIRQLIEQQQVQLLAMRSLISQLPQPVREGFAGALKASVCDYLEAPVSGASAQTDAMVTGQLAMYLEAAGQPPAHGKS
jgi:hypothetical protein